MNLDQARNGPCPHGARWTSPVPCGKCIGERRGVYSDYGGFGYRYTPEVAAREGPIHCGMCWRILPDEDLTALVAVATAKDSYVNAFNGGPDETEVEQKRLRIEHCLTCEPKCERCNRSKQGLCPEPECVRPKGHRGRDGPQWKHADAAGGEWNYVYKGQRS